MNILNAISLLEDAARDAANPADRDAYLAGMELLKEKCDHQDQYPLDAVFEVLNGVYAGFLWTEAFFSINEEVKVKIKVLVMAIEDFIDCTNQNLCECRRAVKLSDASICDACAEDMGRVPLRIVKDAG